MASPPSSSVVEAIEAGTTTVTRRVEFYESDGATKWEPDDDRGRAAQQSSRLIEGSISLDYNRDERRTLDLKLDNRDQHLRPDPDGGLWYDKVIKAFRGVRYPTDRKPPRVAIIEEDVSKIGYEIRGFLNRLGYTRTDVLASASRLNDVNDYDVLVSYMRQGKTAKSTLLKNAYDAGKKIITVGSNNTPTEIPLIATGTAGLSAVSGTYPPSVDTPLAGGWTGQGVAAVTIYRVSTVTPGTTVVAYSSSGLTNPSAMIKENGNGGRWFHYQGYVFGTQAQILLGKAADWLWGYEPYKNWEIQVGEFLIDNMTQPHFPSILSLTGRDYAKRCLQSKVERPMMFEAGTPIEELVRALAANAGITKFKMPLSGKVTNRRIDIERGTPRWQVMKEICTTYGFELFFDNRGYLVMREFIDPVLGALAWEYSTGLDGNLASYERSVNDSNLFNHVIVTATQEKSADDSSSSDDSSPVTYFGEAINNEPSSPTRVDRIGDRSMFYESGFFTSDSQCRDLARVLLKTYGLESYEISWSSFNYPWQEVGEIISFLDPHRSEIEPTRFLMDTLNLNLGPGPMSGTGKRVTFVEDHDLTAKEEALLEGAA